MAPVPPLPVSDLIAFGLLLAALVGLHAVRGGGVGGWFVGHRRVPASDAGPRQ
jgi:hypothetical protein